MQLRIEERAGGAHQPMLQRNQLAVERHEWPHDEFRVESPALDVGTVESKNGARLGYALLYHGGELHLVTWAGFVARQRPGRGGEGEIVIALGRAGRPGDIQRQHEFSAFPG